MFGDQIAGSIFYILALLLVGSSLMVRRMPRGKMLKYGLIWAGIILALSAVILTVQGGR